MISSFVEGKLEHISDTDGSMYAVAHMISGLAGFGCVGIYSNTSKRRSKIMITTSEKRCDATGKVGLSALQKCVAFMRILAYGVPADAVDEYVRIGESTA